MTARRTAARTYIQRIRNATKRAYAEDVYRTIIGGGSLSVQPDGLSYMAAQAVRMNLADILRGRPTDAQVSA